MLLLWQHHWVDDPWEWKDHFNLIKWWKSSNYNTCVWRMCFSLWRNFVSLSQNVKPTTCLEREPHVGTYWVHSTVFRFSARIRFCSAVLRILTLPPGKGQGQSCDHSLTVASSLKGTNVTAMVPFPDWQNSLTFPVLVPFFQYSFNVLFCF